MQYSPKYFHMTLTPRQIISSLVLALFLIIALFGFAMMTHRPDGQMLEDCPFSAMGASFCPQDALALVLHHISAYQSSLVAFINYDVVIFTAFLLFIIGMAPSFLTGPPRVNPLAYTIGLRNAPPIVSGYRRIRNWLSLFENSPSLL